MFESSLSDVRRAAALVKSAHRLVVLTGAGVSKESGIPTFRDAQTGLWANYDFQKLATPEGFLKDPGLVWRWYDIRRKVIRDVKPNPGHFALSELERSVPGFILLTQNIDGLHLVARSKNVIELHGSISRFKCFDNDHPAKDVPCDLEEPPKCFCGSLLRPDIVWFGEALNEDDLRRSYEESQACDVFLVAGTSGLVQPAASLPFVARKGGAKVIECNMEETQITNVADIFLEGPSGELLPELVRLFKKPD